MPQTIESVQDLSANKTKAFVRTLVDCVINFYTKSIENVCGMSMCGTEAIHEINRIQNNPNEKIICVERDLDKIQLVKPKLPTQCEIKHNDWKKEFQLNYKKLNWAWADTCDNPTNENVYDREKEYRYMPSNTVYAITFDLRCRGIAGGQESAIRQLVAATLQPFQAITYQQNRALEYSDNTTHALIKAIIKYIGYAPHTVIHYHGGKNNRTPMVTIIYAKTSTSNFSWSRKAGFKGVNFIDLTKVKKGLSSIEIETHEFKQSLNLSEVKCSDIITQNKETHMHKNELTREDYSKAIRALADQGLSNEQIATMLNISRKKVGGVMAWKNNRSSWAK